MKYASAVTLAIALLSTACTSALADERCDQLVALNRQYAGVRLNDEQRAMKVRLVAWYKANCGGRSGRRALLGSRNYRDASPN